MAPYLSLYPSVALFVVELRWPYVAYFLFFSVFLLPKFLGPHFRRNGATLARFELLQKYYYRCSRDLLVKKNQERAIP